MIDNSSTIQRDPRLLFAESEDDFIVLNPQTNLVYSLNETAREIWKFIDKKRNTTNIVDHLLRIFDASREEIEKDVTLFIEEHKTILFREVKNRPVRIKK